MIDAVSYQTHTFQSMILTKSLVGLNIVWILKEAYFSYTFFGTPCILNTLTVYSEYKHHLTDHHHDRHNHHHDPDHDHDQDHHSKIFIKSSAKLWLVNAAPAGMQRQQWVIRQQDFLGSRARFRVLFPSHIWGQCDNKTFLGHMHIFGSFSPE